jgi:hypothetical protein
MGSVRCGGEGIPLATLPYPVNRDPRGIADEDMEVVRRGGRPILWLIATLLVLGFACAFFMIAYTQLTDPGQPSNGSGWWALVGGLVLLAVSVAHAFVWRRQRVDYKEYRRIACRACGYDRRGLAADAKCPECGTVPTN